MTAEHGQRQRWFECDHDVLLGFFSRARSRAFPAGNHDGTHLEDHEALASFLHLTSVLISSSFSKLRPQHLSHRRPKCEHEHEHEHKHKHKHERLLSLSSTV